MSRAGIRKHKQPLPTFAAALTARRKMLGMSLAVFARHCGCTPGTVWRWETGRSTPHVAKLADIAGILGVNVGFLFRVARKSPKES